MGKILYAPREIIVDSFTFNHKTVGYIVDVVNIKSKETLYKNNEKGSTYYNVEFPYRRDTWCTYTEFKLKPNEIFSSSDECRKYVDEKNEEFFLNKRGWYSLEQLNKYEHMVNECKTILKEQQEKAEQSWEKDIKEILGETT